MAGSTLEHLLERIRDGIATEEDVERARGLVEHDARLPEDIRSALLRDDLQADAVGLLAILGGDDFGDLLRGALAEELDVVDDVMAAIATSAPPVADAVRDEAGEVEVTVETLEALGDLGIPVRDAVYGEGGSVDIAAVILEGLGAAGLPWSAAVHSECGEVEVTESVCSDLGIETVDIRAAVLDEAGDTPQIWQSVLDDISARETLVPEAPVVDFPPDLTVSPAAIQAVPAAANNNRRWGRYGFGALVMAAVALVVVGLSPGTSTVTGTPGLDAPMLIESTDLVFASASDVVVENLEYGDDVMVMQMMGDDGAVILWVDEGEVL
jgi:hypothetical protein